MSWYTESGMLSWCASRSACLCHDGAAWPKTQWCSVLFLYEQILFISSQTCFVGDMAASFTLIGWQITLLSLFVCFAVSNALPSLELQISMSSQNDNNPDWPRSACPGCFFISICDKILNCATPRWLSILGKYVGKKRLIVDTFKVDHDLNHPLPDP